MASLAVAARTRRSRGVGDPATTARPHADDDRGGDHDAGWGGSGDAGGWGVGGDPVYVVARSGDAADRGPLQRRHRDDHRHRQPVPRDRPADHPHLLLGGEQPPRVEHRPPAVREADGRRLHERHRRPAAGSPATSTGGSCNRRTRRSCCRLHSPGRRRRSSRPTRRSTRRTPPRSTSACGSPSPRPVRSRSAWHSVRCGPRSPRRRRRSTYDLGAGDPIVCAGNGTPLPPSKRDSVEQGPCGYTFTDADDVGDTQFTITSTWAVTWRLSDGNTGAEPDIDVSTTIPYEIYEIQTVGRSG